MKYDFDCSRSQHLSTSRYHVRPTVPETGITLCDAFAQLCESLSLMLPERPTSDKKAARRWNEECEDLMHEAKKAFLSALGIESEPLGQFEYIHLKDRPIGKLICYSNATGELGEGELLTILRGHPFPDSILYQATLERPAHPTLSATPRVSHTLYLDQNKFQRWTSALSPPAKNRRGRRKGTSQYSFSDQPLLQRMHELVVRSEFSLHMAAQTLAPEAAGGGSEESKKKRLMRAYQAQFGISLT